MQYKIKTKVWIYPGDVAWHFVTINKKISADIRKKNTKPRRGFGSVPVQVTIGKTTWKTSIFPDSKSGTYLLPIKAKVRKDEGIFEEDIVTIELKT